jgi:hypothetical protein
LILKPPIAASMQEKQNLQKEEKKVAGSDKLQKQPNDNNNQALSQCKTDSSWNSFQRRTYILKTTLPATGTKPLPFLHHHAKHKTQEGE